MARARDLSIWNRVDCALLVDRALLKVRSYSTPATGRRSVGLVSFEAQPPRESDSSQDQDCGRHRPGAAGRPFKWLGDRPPRALLALCQRRFEIDLLRISGWRRCRGQQNAAKARSARRVGQQTHNLELSWGSDFEVQDPAVPIRGTGHFNRHTPCPSAEVNPDQRVALHGISLLRTQLAGEAVPARRQIYGLTPTCHIRLAAGDLQLAESTWRVGPGKCFRVMSQALGSPVNGTIERAFPQLAVAQKIFVCRPGSGAEQQRDQQDARAFAFDGGFDTHGRHRPVQIQFANPGPWSHMRRRKPVTDSDAPVQTGKK